MIFLFSPVIHKIPQNFQLYAYIKKFGNFFWNIHNIP